MLVVVVVVVVVIFSWCLEPLLLLVLLLVPFLLSVFLLLSPPVPAAAAVGAGAIGTTCGVESPEDELSRWLLSFSGLVVFAVALLPPDACLLLLLGWSSSCTPAWWLAREETSIPAPTLAPGGEAPGLLLLAGVEVLGTLMLEDVVSPLDDAEAGSDGRLPSIDQVVLIMGSKLLIPGWRGTEWLLVLFLYCGRVAAAVVGDTMKLSMMREETG